MQWFRYSTANTIFNLHKIKLKFAAQHVEMLDTKCLLCAVTGVASWSNWAPIALLLSLEDWKQRIFNIKLHSSCFVASYRSVYCMQFRVRKTALFTVWWIVFTGHLPTKNIINLFPGSRHILLWGYGNASCDHHRRNDREETKREKLWIHISLLSVHRNWSITANFVIIGDINCVTSSYSALHILQRG